ncbi:hypothetical protein [Flavobacterium salmonis]|uniref:Uncharacterized protein n=1 Tax=Flavobacterium salmonis TaxID=2654844 RepID=A0A6V6Z437_9FLAO|nr:hypothetical protein [Flavobacterium salmonis]CAD0006204.1 hypothetical protein FLAT13_03162 [Flavobacterium salmonis]
MTQQILFIIVILIGAFYARKYGRKAKSDIEKFQKCKANKEEYDKKLDYLNRNVFFGLENQNSGFDSESIKYFLEDDFKIILDRIEDLNLGVNGIEPWFDEEFYDVIVVEDWGNNPFDPNWYKKVFENLKEEKKNLLYAASYVVPLNLL